MNSSASNWRSNIKRISTSPLTIIIIIVNNNDNNIIITIHHHLHKLHLADLIGMVLIIIAMVRVIAMANVTMVLG